MEKNRCKHPVYIVLSQQINLRGLPQNPLPFTNHNLNINEEKLCLCICHIHIHCRSSQQISRDPNRVITANDIITHLSRAHDLFFFLFLSHVFPSLNREWEGGGVLVLWAFILLNLIYLELSTTIDKLNARFANSHCEIINFPRDCFEIVCK